MRRILFGVLYFTSVAVLVVAIALAFNDDNSSKDTVGESQTPATTPQSSGRDNTPAVVTPEPSRDGSSDLSDVGPGNLAAVYVITAAGSALGFSFYQRRKLRVVK